MDTNIKQSQTLGTFKSKLNTTPPVPPTYCLGPRFANIHHCRLRNNCSALNEHLYSNHVLDSPLCACLEESEDTEHFLFRCSRFRDQRVTLDNDLLRYNINADILLHGNNELPFDDNKCIFAAVHKFIKDTRRFR